MISGLPNRPLPGLSRSLTEREAESLDKYLNLLNKWQRSHRLVGSTSRAWLIENVVIDSLVFLDLIPGDTRCIVDIGSGAGIPGIPIAVVRPSIDVVMVEAMRRRVSFLSTVIRELSLANASVVASRVEDLGQKYERKFDVAVMRCAGPPAGLVPLVMRLVKTGGAVVASGSPKERLAPASDGEHVEVHAGRDVRNFRRWRA